jgi:membrane protein DedA with SNARE-associated domain
MLNHTSQEFMRLLPYWGYPAMFVLMILEGPFATMISAFLASQGLFNVGIVFVLSVTGDVVGDIILYCIGHFGGPKIIEKAQKFLKISGAVVEKLKAKFHANSERLIFLVKSTTGLSYITFITAGALRMRFLLFVKNSILGGIVWSAFLVVMGYFFGYAAERISQYIKYAGNAIFIAALVAVIIVGLIKRRESAEILKNNEKK